MAYDTPKTDWNASDIPNPDDFNRIEGNTEDNHERLNGIEDGTTKVPSAENADNSQKFGDEFPSYYYRKSYNVEMKNSADIAPGSSAEIEVDIPTGYFPISMRVQGNKFLTTDYHYGEWVSIQDLSSSEISEPTNVKAQKIQNTSANKMSFEVTNNDSQNMNIAVEVRFLGI